MLIRVKFDPELFRGGVFLAYPTYGFVGEDIVGETIVVDIPEETFPKLPEGMEPPKSVKTYKGPVLTRWHEEGHKLWHAHLDHMYQEHHGEFRPQLV